MLKRLLLLGALLVVLLGGAALGAVPQERIYLVGPAQPLASGPGTFTVQIDGESFNRIWQVKLGVSVMPKIFPVGVEVTAAAPLGVFALNGATCSVQQPGHGQEYALVTMTLPGSAPFGTTVTFTPRQAIMQLTCSYPEVAYGHYTLQPDASATQATTFSTGSRRRSWSSTFLALRGHSTWRIQVPPIRRQ